MQRTQYNTRFETLLKILYQPVPFLPEASFLERGRSEQRKKQALARIRHKSPQERKLRGSIELIGKAKCRICEHTVEISESSWIFGDIRDGAVVEMTVINDGSRYIAKRIVVI